MHSGDMIGHGTTGVVVKVGRDNKKLKVGDRVVALHDQLRRMPYVLMGAYSCCERSNLAIANEAKQIGSRSAGLFGYTYTYEGFPGGQAEYLRFPYAGVGRLSVRTA